MIKHVRIVSLSSGILGEGFVKHELDIGLDRLKSMGLEVSFGANALKGMAYLAAHPEKRAEDLLEAFRDPEVDMILCAIGGDDTYRLLPRLFDNGALESVISDKVFLGFSDTTMNHLMLHKLGIRTFYGQAFLPDVCELGPEMLPYSEAYFTELIKTGTISRIEPSAVRYEGRSDFSPAAVGTRLSSSQSGGWQLLQGPAVFGGEILGGCIDTLYDIFDGTRYSDSPALCARYGLFPPAEDWRGRIILIESSEELMPPEKYRAALRQLKNAGVFGAVSGVLAGRPAGNTYAAQYCRALIEEIDDPRLPVLFNIDVGHDLPRCIIPFGVRARVDAARQVIDFMPDSI